MLIFDRFPDRGSAELFARCVTARTRKQSWVWDRHEDINDVFPWELDPPIVTVERELRNEHGIEDWVIKAVKWFGGTFAGT